LALPVAAFVHYFLAPDLHGNGLDDNRTRKTCQDLLMSEGPADAA